MKNIKVLSLFSGGGLGDYGLMQAGMEISGQIEIDNYCQKILALRYPDSVKWKDIKGVTGEEVKEKCGTIDLVAGGFPCQPFSVAGNQRGSKDDRHLWPEMRRIISEVRPTWVIGENVPGIINIALDDVLNDLESLGYECGTFVFPAHACGAPHRRDRLWIVGYSKHNGCIATKKQGSAGTRNECCQKREIEASESTGPGKQQSSLGSNSRLLRSTINEVKTTGIEQFCKDASNSQSSRLSRRKGKNIAGNKSESEQIGKSCRSEIGGYLRFWETEPGICRVVDGVPHRVDRLKCLGNGQVVHCARFIGEIIMKFNRNQKQEKE